MPAVGLANLRLPTTGGRGRAAHAHGDRPGRGGNIGTLVDETITAPTRRRQPLTVTITVGSGQTTVPPPGSGPGGAKR